MLTLLVSSVAGLQAVEVAEANPATITVPDDYLSIQEAIGNAAAGDTVFVKRGTYENQDLTINKPISLIGEDVKTTILVGNNNIVPQAATTIQINSNNVLITGFTFTNYVHAIGGEGDYIKISSNNVSGRISLTGSSITIEYNNCSSLSCTGNSNHILGNNLTSGIETHGDNNSISGNNLSSGMYVRGSSNTVSGNSVVANPSVRYGSGIGLEGNSNIILRNNLRNGDVGITMGSARTYNNTLSENNITGHSYSGIWLSGGDNNTFARNYIADNKYGIRIGGVNFHAENNVFYHNNFVNLVSATLDNSSLYANFWDNGAEGNFWSSYNGADGNDDGIGDNPFVIDANAQDNYPLMYPFDIENNTIQQTSSSPNPTPIPSNTSTVQRTPPPSILLYQMGYAVMIVVFSAIAIVAGMGLLVYFAKRKTPKKPFP